MKNNFEGNMGIESQKRRWLKYKIENDLKISVVNKGKVGNRAL